MNAKHVCVRALAGAAALALTITLSASAVAQQRPQGTAANHTLEARWLGDTSGLLVYLSDFLTNTVQVFSGTTGQMVGLIFGTNPAGLAVDASGNIYVADEGFISGGQRIVEFAPPGTKAVRILNDTGYQPIGIGLGADGTLYAANDCVFLASFGGCVGGPGNVVAYAPGATEPSFTLNPTGMGAPERVAIDSAGNVVVTGLTGTICSSCNPGSEIMGEFNSSHKKYQSINISHPLTAGHFDAQGRFALVRYPANKLDLYKLPSTKVVGSVSLGTPEPDKVQDFAFSSNGSAVWTAKILYSPGLEHEEALEFSYPAGQQGGAFLFPGTFIYWVAVSPGLQP